MDPNYIIAIVGGLVAGGAAAFFLFRRDVDPKELERIEAEAKYIFSSSNDPLRDREGYRLSLSVGYVF